MCCTMPIARSFPRFVSVEMRMVSYQGAVAVAVPKFRTVISTAIVEPDGADPGDIHACGRRSAPASVVEVVDVVGSAGIELVLVEPGTAVVLLLVVGNANMVVVGIGDEVVVGVV